MRRRILRWVNLLAALAASAALLLLGAVGTGPLPALGPALNPARGVWSAAADAAPVQDETLRLPGLHEQAVVALEPNGVAHVRAATDEDLFFALGYVHARFRLQQMDLERRQGEGLLSEVIGPDALVSDRFELELGLRRTAELEWSQADPETRAVLEAYGRGVNARVSEALGSGDLPLTFRLLGYEPRPWTPLDTLVIKGLETQLLDFQDTPVTYGLLADALGRDRTMSWLPVLPPNEQHPYDPGPYPAAAPPAPISPAQPGAVAAAGGHALAALGAMLSSLPAGAVARGGNSNNWAVDGTQTASGRPLLAGDPHLPLTLPSIWFQVSGDSPGFHFDGVSIPGTPALLIGRNQHIAWSLTNGQNQATFYYREQMDPAHPDRYLWKGSWRQVRHVHYDIPVKGRPAEPLDVRLTVHGPILTQDDQTYSVYWAGALPSQDLTVLLGISRASTFDAFREVLRAWHAPSQNFVYADDAGHIGLISAGYYPLVASGDPWLPLPGTGESDVVGTIPFERVPQVFDPPSHFVFSANQRMVGPDYPYYIGTSIAAFDPGYRANEIHRVLTQGRKLTVADMEALQNDDRDYLAGKVLPSVLAALTPASLSARERQALDLLAGWDDRMDVESAAAAIWGTFWDDYLLETFQPWWDDAHVSVPIARVQDGLTQTLEAWTLGDPGNAAFSPPGAAGRTARDVMLRAFTRTVRELTGDLGPDPATWRWGRIHRREIPSLLQIPSLGYGPEPSSGDGNTPDAARGLVSTLGPSWRFVIDFGTGSGVGVYPGGQSENPASAWYANRVRTWWDGRYDPMLDLETARSRAGTHLWTLRP